jgi:hypothetical protein
MPRAVVPLVSFDRIGTKRRSLDLTPSRATPAWRPGAISLQMQGGTPGLTSDGEMSTQRWLKRSLTLDIDVPRAARAVFHWPRSTDRSACALVVLWIAPSSAGRAELARCNEFGSVSLLLSNKDVQLAESQPLARLNDPIFPRKNKGASASQLTLLHCHVQAYLLNWGEYAAKQIQVSSASTRHCASSIASSWL